MDGEVGDSNFRDFRLHKRLRTLLGRLWRRMGQNCSLRLRGLGQH
ncbi:transposase DNA-binding-containing protein [Cupriavidus sp. D39]